MPVTVEKNGDHSSVSIDGEMTICRAAALKQEIFEGMEWGSAVSLDLSGVSEMDTSGFQLLTLVRNEAALKNCAFSIKAHSAATEAVVELFNMKDCFEAGAR